MAIYSVQSFNNYVMAQNRLFDRESEGYEQGRNIKSQGKEGESTWGRMGAVFLYLWSWLLPTEPAAQKIQVY